MANIMVKELSRSTMRQSIQGTGSMAKRTDTVGRISMTSRFCFNNYSKIIFLRVEIYFALGVRNLWIGMYEGEHRDGKMHGKGVLKYRSGTRYDGEFANDLFEGTGTFYK